MSSQHKAVTKIRHAPQHYKPRGRYRRNPEPVPEWEMRKALRAISLLHWHDIKQDAGWESTTKFGRFLKFVGKHSLQGVVKAGAQQRGWNQGELAKRLGVARGTIYRHLQSQTPSRRTLVRYASAFGVGSIIVEDLGLYVFPDEVYWVALEATDSKKEDENNGKN